MSRYGWADRKEASLLMVMDTSTCIAGHELIPGSSRTSSGQAVHRVLLAIIMRQ